MKTRNVMSSLILCGLASWWSLSNCQAQEGLITPDQATRSGLVVQWFSQLGATDAESIADLALVVDEDSATTFFKISGGRLGETISEFDLGPFGKPFGVEGAKEFAELRREIMQAMLKRDLVEEEVKIEQYTIPETTLYTISKTGMLNAVDAETGKLRWRVAVGDRKLPTLGMGANKAHIAVVNGSTVFVLDSRSGKVLWDRTLKDSVAGSPAVNDKYIFVPLDNGRLQTLPFETQGLGQATYVALGQTSNHSAPILEGSSVAWATSRGVTVAPSNAIGSMRFRIETESAISSSPASRGGIIFVASQQGFIYAVSERDSDLLWRYPTGERISHDPIPLGDDLYVITESNNLFRFDARTGAAKPGWERPMRDVVQYVGAGENHLYILDSAGQLVTIDRESGTILGRVSSDLSLRTFSNLQSDRLYVCHKTGLIQCLREPGSDRPMFHSGEFTEIVKADSPTDPKTGTDEGDASNPFGGGSSNPFDGGGTTTPSTSNPFGGETSPPANNDPFSGGGASGNSPPNNDPFSGGGSSNPPAGGGNSGANDDPFAGGGGAGMAANDPFAGGATGGNTGGASGASDDPFAGGGGANMANNSGAGNATSGEKVTVWKDVQAVFKKRCGTCHGSRNPKGGFDTSSMADLLKGGDSGSPITTGDAAGSRLYQLITHADEPKMPPPANADKIPDDEIALIEAWINGGALDKQPAAATGNSNSGTDSSDPFAGGN